VRCTQSPRYDAHDTTYVSSFFFFLLFPSSSLSSCCSIFSLSSSSLLPSSSSSCFTTPKDAATSIRVSVFLPSPLLLSSFDADSSYVSPTAREAMMRQPETCPWQRRAITSSQQPLRYAARAVYDGMRCYATCAHVKREMLPQQRENKMRRKRDIARRTKEHV